MNVMSRVAAPAAPYAAALAGLAGVSYIATVDPNQPGHYPTCLVLWATGWNCPGCGSLRAVHALAHGDVLGAVAYNPLMVAAIPLLVAMWVAWCRRTLTGRPRTWAAPGGAIWGLLILVIVFAVARNLPGLQFLAP